MSDIYRRWTGALPGGLYLATPPPEARTIAAVRRMAADNRGYGIDWENAKTVLSIGAPLLDGWGAPGRIWEARSGFFLIQAETGGSSTADLADQWLALRPGTETEFALGVARVLIGENLYAPAADRAEGFAAFRQLAESADAGRTGLRPDQIEAVARRLSANQPALAVGGGTSGGPLGADAETAIAGLNALLGAVGRKGGFVARRSPAPPDAPQPESLSDAAIGVLLLDEAPGGYATPWETLRPKLKQGAVVIALSPFAEGVARHAEWHVPAPVFLETLQEAATPPDAPRDLFALAPPLLPALAGAMAPDAFLNKLAPLCGWPPVEPLEAALKQKSAELFAAKRGSLFAFQGGEAKTPKNAEEFWSALTAGNCWVGEASEEAPPRRVSLPDRLPAVQQRPAAELALVTVGWKAESGGAPVSPILAKLYQESGLKPAVACMVLNPETGRANGLVDGGSAILRTECGERRLRVDLDESVAPGVVEAAGPPPADVMDLCRPRGGCSWRMEPASVRKA